MGPAERGLSGGGALLLTGVVGLIRWHYYTAAAINGYTVTRARDRQWSLRAAVVNADAFKMAQVPLVFVAKHKKGEWRFPIESLEYRKDTGQLTARLKPPEGA